MNQLLIAGAVVAALLAAYKINNAAVRTVAVQNERASVEQQAQKRMTKLGPLVALLLIPTLSACSKSEANYETSLSPKVCQSWEKIRASRKDTGDTLKQVAGNNVARDAWCVPPTKFASPTARA